MVAFGFSPEILRGGGVRMVLCDEERITDGRDAVPLRFFNSPMVTENECQGQSRLHITPALLLLVTQAPKRLNKIMVVVVAVLVSFFVMNK